MNALTARELKGLFKTILRRTDELQPGNILATEWGYDLVGSVAQQPDGTYQVFDHFGSGEVRCSADFKHEIVYPNSLRPEGIQALCEQRRRAMAEDPE